MVEVVGFAPFQGAVHALENANDLSEGIVSDYLRTVLETNLPKASPKHKLVLGVYDKNLANGIKTAFDYVECETRETSEIVAGLLRGLRLHAEKLLKQLQEGDLERAQLGLGHAYSRAKVKFNVEKNDRHITQAIALLDQLDKAVNKFAMRVREWYSWHFPELLKIVSDNLTYSKLALAIGDKNRLSDADIHDVAAIVNDDSDIAGNIIHAARNSMGRDITEYDLEAFLSLARRAISLAEYRTDLHIYLVEKMNVVAPNLAALIGETIGARLISHAGSLTNLAKAPASTVQILGAEKALFRALKTKGNTPKYGLIYNSTFIGRAAIKDKGRISRFLANKASLASRVDHFAQEPSTAVGKAFRQQVEERLEFYASGKPPTKNEVVMKNAMEETLANIHIEDPTEAGAEDEIQADGVTAQATEQALRKEKSKEDKKKEKREKKMAKKMAKVNGDAEMPDADDINGDAETVVKKESKKEKKRKVADVDGEVDGEVNGEKKKKKKKDKKAPA
ncbi:MAG: hypothetical protein Q9165_001409 [Trypethelium subeluteriae]